MCLWAHSLRCWFLHSKLQVSILEYPQTSSCTCSSAEWKYYCFLLLLSPAWTLNSFYSCWRSSISDKANGLAKACYLFRRRHPQPAPRRSEGTITSRGREWCVSIPWFCLWPGDFSVAMPRKSSVRESVAGCASWHRVQPCLELPLGCLGHQGRCRNANICLSVWPERRQVFQR